MRALALLLLAAAPAFAQPTGLDPADRARLAEAFRLAASVGDTLWGAGEAVPFAVLLVTGEREVLVRHPSPSVDFALVDAADPVLGGSVYVRPRQFAPTLLATFPAVGGVPTVVVGTPEATGRASTDYVLTLLHERLHQLQMATPGYFEAVAALGLDGGDATGMWMLTYPFPYADPEIGARFGVYRDALVAALAAPAAEASARWASIRAARAHLDAALPPADVRYLSFQLWQEGAARFSELRVAEAAARLSAPVAAYRALPDAVPYAVAADSLRARLARDLAGLSLADDGRVAFYAAGAAEAAALDAARPGWRRRALAGPFDLGRLGGD